MLTGKTVLEFYITSMCDNNKDKRLQTENCNNVILILIKIPCKAIIKQEGSIATACKLSCYPAFSTIGESKQNRIYCIESMIKS